MVCIFCTSDTQVINSRWQKRANSTWRRRRCIDNNHTFTTIEQSDYEKSWVVQYTISPQRPFVREELLLSIFKSCQHRPTALHDAVGLTGTVISSLKHPAGVTTSQEIAEQTYATLKRFDTAAATYYKAYHADVL